MVNRAKHKMRIPEEIYEYFNKEYLKSIRSSVLQKLVFLLYRLRYPHSLLRKELEQRILEESKKRLKEMEAKGEASYFRPLRICFVNLVSFLKVEDICKALRCQERTAKEYLDALQVVTLFFIDEGYC